MSTFVLEQQPMQQLKAILMNISTLFAGITPANRLGDAPPPINLEHRDPDYYKVPLVILVSLLVVFHDTSRQLSF
jgi:hypothetical protein